MRHQAVVRPTLYTISREFQPTRVALDCLALAYEQLLPLTLSHPRDQPSPTRSDEASSTPLLVNPITPGGVLS